MFFYQRISVRPGQIGHLFKRNIFQKRLSPGIYTFWDFQREIDVVILPSIRKMLSVRNQEVLTKDNIALRFSYFVLYKIENENNFLSKFDLFQKNLSPIEQAETVIHDFSQVYLRQYIAQIDSQEINEKRQDIFDIIPEKLSEAMDTYGIHIEKIMLKDITFPKMIQELFARQLESKIRAKIDLENARTAVATARALKNASEMMKGDDNIKFLKFLEAITQIASKGKHTFLIGDINQK